MYLLIARLTSILAPPKIVADTGMFCQKEFVAKSSCADVHAKCPVETNVATEAENPVSADLEHDPAHAF